MEPIAFADGLDLGFKGKGGIKNDAQVFGLCNWRNRAALREIEKVVGGFGEGGRQRSRAEVLAC